jgi:biopolymer transport protein ExbB/TolQ
MIQIKKMKNTTQFSLLRKAAFMALFFYALVVASFYALASQSYLDSGLGRFVLFLGGDFLSGGYIQFITYLVYLFAYYLIKDRSAELARQEEYIQKVNLPKSAKDILLENDVNRIRVESEEKGPKDSIINTIVIRACRKFRSSQSVPETMEMVSDQISFYNDHEYVGQTTIRYLNWCIPSLGFIGTILGIAGAMQFAGSGNVKLVTASLGVAFDTTLLALVLSIIINWRQGELEKRSASVFLQIKEAITDRLINRIEVIPRHDEAN